MLQHLLAERFGLALHHELRDFPAYELTVAKSGLKMKVSSIDPNTPFSQSRPIAPRDGGFPVLPEGVPASATDNGESGVFHTAARAQTLAALLRWLEYATGATVVDKTGLTGAYDYNLEFTVEGLTGTWALKSTTQAHYLAALRAQGGEAEVPAADGPNLFSALEKQLGLKLEKKSEPVDVLVVDHAEKVAAAN
jgi:uncharacterized protein (TIGR03435 family)